MHFLVNKICPKSNLKKYSGKIKVRVVVEQRGDYGSDTIIQNNMTTLLYFQFRAEIKNRNKEQNKKMINKIAQQIL